MPYSTRMFPVQILPHQFSSRGPKCTPSPHPPSSSNREVGRLSPCVLTSSNRIRPQRYFIFHVKERTTTELTLALQTSLAAQEETKQPCSPLIAVLLRVILLLKTGYGFTGLFLGGQKGAQRQGKWKRELL